MKLPFYFQQKIPSKFLAEEFSTIHKNHYFFPYVSRPFPFPQKSGTQPTQQPTHRAERQTFEAHLGEILGQLPRMVDACGLSNASGPLGK